MLRTALLLASLLGGALLAPSAPAFTLWNDLRASALLPGGEVTIRVENPHGAGLQNTILYAAGGVQEAALAAVDDGPSTLEATVPGPGSDRRWYGFRLVQGTDLDLLTPWLAGGVTPARTDLARLADDPTGDEVFGRVNLDLTACRVGRDGTRLWAAVTNAGGGFPTADGLTFFSYLLGITNPADSDPDTVLALIQTVDVAGVIEPGLYQINGPDVDDLVKIGEITATELPGEDTLLLSCDLADLEANAFLQNWYDPADPRLGVAGFSQRITVFGGAQEADRTPGGVWHLREAALDPQANQLPELADLVLPEPGSGGTASVLYADANANCPVIAELVIDGAQTYPLRPQALDYAVPVTYRSAPALPPLESGDWLEVVARFSDDAVALVEVSETAVGVADARTGLQLRAAPNPFAGRAAFTFTLDRAEAVELTVHDLAGRRLATLVRGRLAAGPHAHTWDGRDGAGRPQPSGVYVYRLRTPDEVVVRRVTMLR